MLEWQLRYGFVRTVTPYVTGISEDKGGAGNPSPITAYGVFMGMKAAANHAFGTNILKIKLFMFKELEMLVKL